MRSYFKLIILLAVLNLGVCFGEGHISPKQHAAVQVAKSYQWQPLTYECNVSINGENRTLTKTIGPFYSADFPLGLVDTNRILATIHHKDYMPWSSELTMTTYLLDGPLVLRKSEINFEKANDSVQIKEGMHQITCKKVPTPAEPSREVLNYVKRQIEIAAIGPVNKNAFGQFETLKYLQRVFEKMPLLDQKGQTEVYQLLRPLINDEGRVSGSVRQAIESHSASQIVSTMMVSEILANAGYMATRNQNENVRFELNLASQWIDQMAPSRPRTYLAYQLRQEEARLRMRSE